MASELKLEEGGWRRYVDGRPVHCGDVLEVVGALVQPARYEARGLGDAGRPPEERLVLATGLELCDARRAGLWGRVRWPAPSTKGWLVPFAPGTGDDCSRCDALEAVTTCKACEKPLCGGCFLAHDCDAHG